MKISVEDISIKTASIEVKTLTLTRKQVTLAVFRQLDNIYCIDMDDFKIRGKIWGRINYHHNCIESKKHLHLVCEISKKIYHGIIYEEFDQQCVYYKIDTERAYGIPELCEEDVWANKYQQIWSELSHKWNEVYYNIRFNTDHLFIAV